MTTVRVLAAATLAFVLGTTHASAQDAQYWNIQYGPVAQLLGGQVVGSTRDLSATYYNPGGLGLTQDPGFLFSVQGFKAETVSIKPLDAARCHPFRRRPTPPFPASWPWPFRGDGSARRRTSPSRS